MISKTFEVAAFKLGLGKVKEQNIDHFITENGVYCTSFDAKRIIELQEKYGTGQVNYCPNLSIVCTGENRKIDRTLILKKSGHVNSDIAYTVAKSLGKKVEQIVTNQMSIKAICDEVYSSSFVIVSGDMRENVIYTLVSSGVPFLLLGYNNRAVEQLLRTIGLEILMCHNNTLAVSKANQIYDNYDIVSSTLLETTDRLKRYIEWAADVSSFKDKSFLDLDTYRESSFSLRYSLSPHEYTDFYSNELSEQLYLHSSTGGIHFRTSVTRDTCLLLHPWIGIVDTFDVEVVKSLLQKKSFQVSLSMCQGLFVYSNEIKKLFTCDVSIIEFNIVKSFTKLFDYYGWLEDRFVTNLENPRETVSLNGKNGQSLNFVCSLANPEKYIHRLITMVSRCIPIVVQKTKLTEIILGRNYPLYSTIFDPYKLNNILTTEKVEETVNYLHEHTVDISKIVDIMEHTGIGRKLIY